MPAVAQRVWLTRWCVVACVGEWRCQMSVVRVRKGACVPSIEWLHPLIGQWRLGFMVGSGCRGGFRWEFRFHAPSVDDSKK